MHGKTTGMGGDESYKARDTHVFHSRIYSSDQEHLGYVSEVLEDSPRSVV